MQTTWEQMGDMNLIDVDDVDFDSLTDIQESQVRCSSLITYQPRSNIDCIDVMNDRLDSLQTCNQGFVDVANQSQSFSQYGDMSVFQDNSNDDIKFGWTESRFDTPLLGPNGEALTVTADGHYLIKGTDIEVPYSQTKSP
jgi:hypothetical protein